MKSFEVISFAGAGMAFPNGARIELSLPRRWIADLMAVSRSVPFVTGEGRMKAGQVEKARRRISDGPTWTALFLKALSIFAKRRPEFRRMYMPFPTPHLYQADENVANISVSRVYQGEAAVFFGQMRSPEEVPLLEIAAELKRWRSAPISSIRPFARLIKYSRFPLFLRRVFWRLGMNLSGKRRAKTFGIFGITVLGGARARITSFLAPTAFNLSFGSVENDGSMNVAFSMDHRVIDGMTAVRASYELESILNNEIVAELHQLAANSQLAAA